MRWIASLGFLLLTLVPAVAGEKGAAAGTGRTTSLGMVSRLTPDDVSGHVLVQGLETGEIRTPDRIGGVSFEGAVAKLYRQSDMVGPAGVVRGYGTWEAKSGERLYLIVGYTMTPVKGAENVTLEGTFEWTEGTGPLEGIHGKGTIEGDISPEGEINYRWAGSYEK